MMYATDMASGGMTYMMFHDDHFRHSSKIKVTTSCI
jgi:hypothetical protein